MVRGAFPGYHSPFLAIFFIRLLEVRIAQLERELTEVRSTALHPKKMEIHAARSTPTPEFDQFATRRSARTGCSAFILHHHFEVGFFGT
ncbi:MAG: hypothetical protein AB1513_01395 [Pseudomonadota bacterium]